MISNPMNSLGASRGANLLKGRFFRDTLYACNEEILIPLWCFVLHNLNYSFLIITAGCTQGGGGVRLTAFNPLLLPEFIRICQNLNVSQCNTKTAILVSLLAWNYNEVKKRRSFKIEREKVVKYKYQGIICVQMNPDVGAKINV